MPVLPYKGVWPKIADGVFIAPGAMVIGNVTIHEGASVWYNAVIRADSAPIVIGRRSNIQDNCTLHIDADAPLTIGEECTIGHNAIVHGATLGNRILVGMHATILSHATVGPETVVGANALIAEYKEIPGNSLAIGVPARVARLLKEEERAALLASAEHYYHLSLEHRESTENH